MVAINSKIDTAGVTLLCKTQDGWLNTMVKKNH